MDNALDLEFRVIGVVPGRDECYEAKSSPEKLHQYIYKINNAYISLSIANQKLNG